MKLSRLAATFLILLTSTFFMSAQAPPTAPTTPVSPNEARPNDAAANSDEESTEETEKKPKYEVQLQLSSERLTRGFGTWRSAALYVQRSFENRRIVWGMYRVSDRNGSRDKEFIGGIYQPLKNRWAITTEAMYSPSRIFVGRVSAMVEVEKALRRGFVVHGGTRFTKYNGVTAVTGYGLAEKYWGANRVAYTLFVTRLSNAGSAPSHRLQYNRYFGERNNTVGVSFSVGREHENLGPQIGILRTSTKSVGVTARHWFTDRFGFSFDGFFHRQGEIYDRRGVVFGLRYRF